MKNLCILTNNISSAEKLKQHLSDYNIKVTDNPKDADNDFLTALYDYSGNLDDETIEKNKVINIHSSLLPAFDTETPIKDAYLYGAKVTGVTVYEVKAGMTQGKILAQYPVIIDNYTHYDDLAEEIEKLSTTLYPLVIKSIMEDKVFDIVELLAPPKLHACGSCVGCASAHFPKKQL